MVTFFRKLRIKLLADGKISKYLIYALGEIILVVIGILIALQINNWNQERKDNDLATNYLERIHRDIVLDTISFHKRIESNKALRIEVKSVLVDLSNNVDSFEEATRICTVFGQVLDQIFTPNDNTYKGMMSSGNQNLIKNTALSESIANLYSDYDTKSSLFKYNKEWMDAISIHLDSHTDLVKFSAYTIDIYPQPEMLNETDFAFLNDSDDERYKIVIRAMSACAWTQKAANEYYEALLVLSKEVLETIDEELKNQ